MGDKGCRSSLFVVALGVLMLAGFWGFEALGPVPEPRELPEASSEDSKVLMFLEARVRALQERVDALERSPLPRRPSVPSPVVAEPVTPSASRPDIDDEPPTVVEPDPAQGDSEAARVRQTLHERLEGEGVDPTWATEQEARILTDLDGSALGSAYVTGAECRSTLCRIELEHPEGGDLDRLLLEVMSKPAFAGRRMFFEQDLSAPGAGRMTVFLARAGEALPLD